MGCVVYLHLTGFWQAGEGANGRGVTGSGRVGAQEKHITVLFPMATQFREQLFTAY